MIQSRQHFIDGRWHEVGRIKLRRIYVPIASGDTHPADGDASTVLMGDPYKPVWEKRQKDYSPNWESLWEDVSLQVEEHKATGEYNIALPPTTEGYAARRHYDTKCMIGMRQHHIDGVWYQATKPASGASMYGSKENLQ